MFSGFNKKKQRMMPRQNDDCKIKIKNTSQGKQIEFSGKCSKEELLMAKMNFDSSDDIEEFDD